MTSLGMHIVTVDEFTVEVEDEEYPQAFDKDHDEWANRIAPSHVYLCDLVQISNHEWISPVVRDIRGDIREEYRPPIADLSDRAEVEFEELGPKEAVCNWCHLAYLASRKSCPTCEEVDA